MGLPAQISALSDPAAAAVLLEPMRLRILAQLEEPDSASGVARRLRLPRQKVNYHLRELEKHGLVELVGERKRGNCTERMVRASARSYVISPEALGPLGADPSHIQDRFSSAYLVAVAAKAIREVAILQQRAAKAEKKLATLTMQSEVRFASAAQRSRFAAELAQAMARLVSKYHDESAAGGRRFQVLVGAYPTLEQAGKPKRQKAQSPIQPIYEEES